MIYISQCYFDYNRYDMIYISQCYFDYNRYDMINITQFYFEYSRYDMIYISQCYFDYNRYDVIYISQRECQSLMLICANCNNKLRNYGVTLAVLFLYPVTIKDTCIFILSLFFNCHYFMHLEVINNLKLIK